MNAAVDDVMPFAAVTVSPGAWAKRDLVDQIADPAQVAQPRLGGASDPAAMRRKGAVLHSA
jgi:hypothetical protein